MTIRRKLKFTIYHGFAASIALHSAIGAAVVLPRIAPVPAPSPAVLVIQLQGAPAEVQSEQRVLGEASMVQASVSAQPEKPLPETQPTTETADALPVKPVEAPPTQVTQVMPEVARSSVTGADEQQPEQTITAMEKPDPNRDRDYGIAVAKIVQTKLILPEWARRAGLRGITGISFTILSNGEIREGSVKVAISSGHAALDAAALQTVRASAPFNPPPREMPVMIRLDFDPRF